MTFATLIKSKMFWTLVAGLLTFFAKYFYPAFPLDEDQILGVIVFLLGLFSITPELKVRGLL